MAKLETKKITDKKKVARNKIKAKMCQEYFVSGANNAQKKMTVIINSAHLLEIYLCNQCLIVFFPN
jgi:hypothetical protein